MRKAYVVQQPSVPSIVMRVRGSEGVQVLYAHPAVVRVKLTAYKPARPVTLERFRGIPASAAKAAFRAAPLALVRDYEAQFNHNAYIV